MFRYWNDIFRVPSRARAHARDISDIVHSEFVRGIRGIDVSGWKKRKHASASVCLFLYFASCFDFAVASLPACMQISDDSIVPREIMQQFSLPKI